MRQMTHIELAARYTHARVIQMMAGSSKVDSALTEEDSRLFFPRLPLDDVFRTAKRAKRFLFHIRHNEDASRAFPRGNQRRILQLRNGILRPLILPLHLFTQRTDRPPHVVSRASEVIQQTFCISWGAGHPRPWLRVFDRDPSCGASRKTVDQAQDFLGPE